MNAIFVYTTTRAHACPDPLIQHTICKHVYAVARHLNTNTTTIDANTTEQPIWNPEELIDSVLKTVQQPRDDILKEKEAILHKMTMLTAQIQQCSNASALCAVRTHISFASSIIKVISSESGPTYTTTSNEPSNKKVVPQ